MAKQGEEFDVLTFFIYVMVLLTLIVGGFALLNRSRLNKDSMKLKGAVRGLSEMEELALDEDFRDWISRERNNARLSGGSGRGNTQGEFRALGLSLSNRQGLDRMLQGRFQRRGVNTDPMTQMKEAQFGLTFEGIRVEQLTKYLVTLEEKWPGCRVTRINELKYNKDKKSWKASVQVSIYNPSDS